MKNDLVKNQTILICGIKILSRTILAGIDKHPLQQHQSQHDKKKRRDTQCQITLRDRFTSSVKNLIAGYSQSGHQTQHLRSALVFL